MNIDHGVQNSIYRTGRVARGYASFTHPYNILLLCSACPQAHAYNRQAGNTGPSSSSLTALLALNGPKDTYLSSAELANAELALCGVEPTQAFDLPRAPVVH
jgi:hypothetical protein